MTRKLTAIGGVVFAVAGLVSAINNDFGGMIMATSLSVLSFFLFLILREYDIR